MTEGSPAVAILGAGAAGLAAAWELVDRGVTDVRVLERSARIGGLLSYFEKNGNRFEYGTHVFHTNNEELRDRVRMLMGEQMFEFDRLSKLHIKFQGKYFRYPLNGLDIMFNLPPLLSLQCAMSMALSTAASRISPRHAANTAELLQQRFGRKLYEVFFKDYTHKFWGRPCEELDRVFAQERIPRSDVFKIVHDIFEKIGLGRIGVGDPLTERAIGKLYYTKKGIFELPAAMAAFIEAKSRPIETGIRLTRIRVESGQVAAVDYEVNGEPRSAEVSHVISTIPIRHLIPLFSPQPGPEVTAAAERLRHLPLTVCGLLVRRKPVRDAYCTYFRESIFNRLSEPTNHGLQAKPEGRSILLAEMTDFTIQQAGLRTDDEIVEAVISDLLKEGLIDRDEVEETCVFRYQEAYPIYHIGFQRDVAITKDYLASLGNVQSTGRQGEFAYVNTHVTMQMAITAARAIPTQPS